MPDAMPPTIWENFILLFHTLGTLVLQIASLGYHWLFWLVLGAWCLWGVNWKRTRHYLAVGAWAPVILLMLVIALAWSRIDPRPCDCLGFMQLPNFWWQLGFVTMLAAIAMFLGWIQSVMHWTPHDINLDPPAHAHGHGHDHH